MFVVENTETNVSVRSLTMTIVHPDHEIAKASISNVDLVITTQGRHKNVEGQLGSMSLLDLTLQGQQYRERFLTSGEQALTVKYVRFAPTETADYDAQLKLTMSSVTYVHTKRFVVELQAFFYQFTQLQLLMQGIRAAASSQKVCLFKLLTRVTKFFVSDSQQAEKAFPAYRSGVSDNLASRQLDELAGFDRKPWKANIDQLV